MSVSFFCLALSWVGPGLAMKRPSSKESYKSIKGFIVSEVNPGSEQTRGHNLQTVQLDLEAGGVVMTSFRYPPLLRDTIR
jgi:hypothetical protein